jgi:hypothetical protein
MIEFYGGYQVYSDSGVDLTLLRENLKRTLTQRWQQNCDSLPFLDALRDSGASRSASVTPRDSTMLDLPGLIRQLQDHQVEYVVIDGLAMIAQGSASMTRDLDICYARTPGNINSLAQAMASLHPRLRGAPADLPFQFDPPTIRAGLNFTLTTDLGDVDVLGEVAGIGSFAQVLAKSEERMVYDLHICVLTIDGLIAAKKAAGRGKDHDHLRELAELKKLREQGA